MFECFNYWVSGNACYNIPLAKGWRLKYQLPLEFKRCGLDTHIVYCPAFDEYGYGNSPEEAMIDLGDSIIDLYKSLKRLKRRRNWGDSLCLIFDNLNYYIERG